MRFRFVRSLLWLALALLTQAISFHATAQARYTITDLGDLGQGISVAEAVNNSGQVTGESLRAGVANYPYVFLWDSLHGIQDLNVFNCAPLAINDAGAIVGYGYPGTSTQQGFLYSGGTLTALVLPGGPFSEANGIDADGTVVGRSDTVVNGTAYSHAFRYDSINGIWDLGEFSPGKDSVAERISNGHIVGWAGTADRTPDRFVYHAFLHSGPGPLDPQKDDLGTLGGTTSEASGVNPLGQVTGTSTTGAKNPQGNDINHAFLYSGGQMYDLGTLPNYEGSVARRINASGQIIGSVISGSSSSPFLWTPNMPNETSGKMELISDLLTANSGWTLEYVRDINDQGWIVGYGQYKGNRRAFLIRPFVTKARLGAPEFGSTLQRHDICYIPFHFLASGTSNTTVSGRLLLDGQTYSNFSLQYDLSRDEWQHYQGFSVPSSLLIGQHTLQAVIDSPVKKSSGTIYSLVTGFDPGKNGWQFSNRSTDYIFAWSGLCLGMSVQAWRGYVVGPPISTTRSPGRSLWNSLYATHMNGNLFAQNHDLPRLEGYETKNIAISSEANKIRQYLLSQNKPRVVMLTQDRSTLLNPGHAVIASAYFAGDDVYAANYPDILVGLTRLLVYHCFCKFLVAQFRKHG